MIWTLLTSRLAGPVLSVALALTLAFAIPAGLKNHKLQRQAEAALGARDVAEANLAVCKASAAALDAARSAQNAALRAEKEAGDQRAAELAKALQAARKAASAADVRADRLEAFRPKSAGVCEALLEVDQQVRSRQ